MSFPHPPPHGHPGPVPIRVDPRELRPGRFWYAVGALVLVGGFVTALVGFLVSVLSTVALPEFEARVSSGQEAVFTVTETDTLLGLYSSGGDADPCVLVRPDGTESGFGLPGYSHDVDTGSESWSLVGAQEAPETGEYTLSCPGASGTAEFAVADVGDGGAEFVRGVAGTLLWAFVPSFLGLLLGLPVLITTAVRRNRHRRRLLVERRQGFHGPATG
ncbi:hypothetical protein ACWFMI_06665 [Nocardiopsis terrae]